MNQLIKYEDPKNLQEAVQLSHNLKIWASSMPDEELAPRLSLLIEDVCLTIGQRNVDPNVIKAGIKSLKSAIQGKYKTLHFYEVRKAVMNWADNPSIDVKHFSGANMVKAIDEYDRNERHKLIKQLWKKDEEVKKEYTTEEKEQMLESFYKTWKKCNEVDGHHDFFGYTAAYKLLKELGKTTVDKDYYWETIQQAKESVLNDLKNQQVQRVISGIVYKNQVETIESITYENFWRKDGLKGAESLEAECQRIMVVDYFMEKTMDE